jgi:hypothetical protein
VSNDDRDTPEFDEFDLSDEMLEPGDQDASPADETDQPLAEDLPGDLDEPDGPGDDFDGPLAAGDEFDAPMTGEGDAVDEPLAEGDEFDGPLAAEGEEGQGDDFALPTADEEDAAAEESKEDESDKDEEKEKKKGLLAKLLEASPYTVMLAISLGSILFAILLLFLSLLDYNGDIKAKEGTQRVGVAVPLQPGSPSTRAVA